jgi:hypothetical protein
VFFVATFIGKKSKAVFPIISFLVELTKFAKAVLQPKNLPSVFL